MEVFWLEQGQAEVRAADDWLSPAERARYHALRVPKRREDWRLGRWTAKHAVAAYLGLPADASALAAIEIRPAVSGAPEAFLNGAPASVSISLSHRDGRAACAVAPAGTAVGCDLEVVEPRSDSFVSDYFTDHEQRLVAQAAADGRLLTVALLWSAKESTLKALREGLRIDTRQVEVEFVENHAAMNKSAAEASSWDSWYPLRTGFEQQAFHGWWRREQGFVLTLVTAPESRPPMRIPIAPQLANGMQ